MNTMRYRCFAILCAALLVGYLVPVPAVAEPSDEIQAQLEEAQATLDGLYADAETASNALNKTLDDLAATTKDVEETTAQIEVKQTELADAQQVLGETVAADYKGDTTTLVSIILSSTSIEDFVSRIYYANKVNEAYSAQINTVRDIQQDLEEKKTALEEQQASLEQLRTEQEANKAALEERAYEAQSYVDGLSGELQEALAAEAEARAEAARAEAAAALAAQGGNEETGVDDAPEEEEKPQEESKPEEQEGSEEQETEEKPEEQEEETPEPEQQEEETSEPESEPEPEQEEETPEDSGESEESPSAGLSNRELREAVVNYVLSKVGCSYVWATHGPNTFDCSGLTGAAYDSIGYFVGYSDSYQVQFCNKPASEAVYGDIVWRPGHVGLCIGGGVTVEAFNPARGVGYGSVSTFQRAGSPLG